MSSPQVIARLPIALAAVLLAATSCTDGRRESQETSVRVTVPERGALVASPLEVRGEARGLWYFEGRFPVELVDANDETIATSVARAQGEWTTQDYVPFEAEIDFDRPASAEGALVFRKANSSGRPENAAEVRVPVRFR